MNHIYCAWLAVNLIYYGRVCEFSHVCKLFSINNNNYYLKRLNFKNFVIRNNRKKWKLGPMLKCPRSTLLSYFLPFTSPQLQHSGPRTSSAPRWSHPSTECSLRSDSNFATANILRFLNLRHKIQRKTTPRPSSKEPAIKPRTRNRRSRSVWHPVCGFLYLPRSKPRSRVEAWRR